MSQIPYKDPVRREGYNRPKPTSAWIAQGVWFFIGLVGAVVFYSPESSLASVLIALAGLINIVWVEWSSRCEDQVKVNIVFGAIMAFLALWAVRNRNERRNLHR